MTLKKEYNFDYKFECRNCDLNDRHTFNMIQFILDMKIEESKHKIKNGKNINIDTHYVYNYKQIQINYPNINTDIENSIEFYKNTDNKQKEEIVNWAVRWKRDNPQQYNQFGSYVPNVKEYCDCGSSHYNDIVDSLVKISIVLYDFQEPDFLIDSLMKEKFQLALDSDLIIDNIVDSTVEFANGIEKKIELEVADVRPQRELSSMQDQWRRENDAFIIVFSMISHLSLEEVYLLIEKCLRAKDDDLMAILLCGKDCHLTEQYQVNDNDINELVQEFREKNDDLIIDTIKISLQKNINIQESMQKISNMYVRCMVRKQQRLTDSRV